MVSGRSYDGIRNRAIICLLSQTGLRRMEVVALDLSDYDVENGEVAVRCGKGGKSRVALAGDDTSKAIWRYLQVREQRARAGCTALFVSRLGHRMTPSGIGQLISRIGREAGIDGLHPHQFRHSWTHYVLDSGMSEHNIITLGGWSTTKQLGRYGRALQQERAIKEGRKHLPKLGGLSTGLRGVWQCGRTPLALPLGRAECHARGPPGLRWVQAAPGIPRRNAWPCSR